MLRLDKDTNNAFWVLRKNPDNSLLCCYYNEKTKAEQLIKRGYKHTVKLHEQYLEYSIFSEESEEHSEYFSMKITESGKWIVEIPKKVFLFERNSKNLLEIKLSLIMFIWHSLKYLFKSKYTLPYSEYLEHCRAKSISSQ